jgi:hypothetical protein
VNKTLKRGANIVLVDTMLQEIQSYLDAFPTQLVIPYGSQHTTQGVKCNLSFYHLTNSVGIMASQTSAVKRRIAEKKALRTQLIQSDALPRNQIEILCSLDSEFDLLSHIKKQLLKSATQIRESNQRPHPLPNVPRFPAPPNFFGPDPDHMRPPGFDDFERDRNPPLPQFPFRRYF